jgi:hypothetical protein
MFKELKRLANGASAMVIDESTISFVATKFICIKDILERRMI